MRLVISGPKDQWLKAGTAWEKTIAHAATAAVRETGEAARDAVRRNIAGAGFGPSWQASIRSVMHPKTGDVLNPFAWVHSTKNFSDVFETGKTITAKTWLWLPLPAVPPWPGDPTRQMSPHKFITTIGPLVFMKRPGRPPLLGAVGFFSTRAPIASQKISKRTFSPLHSAGKKKIVVPMFVGVHTVTIEKRFNAYAEIAKEAEKLPERYAKNFVPYEGRR